MILDRLFEKKSGVPAPPTVRNAVTMESIGLGGYRDAGESAAMKLAAVNRCLEVLSDSMGKMPTYAMMTDTRKRVFPPVLNLLNLRPNEAMTPFVQRKLLEGWRLSRGNAFEWIIRDPISMEPVELIPMPPGLVSPWRDTTGRVWYDVCHPYTGSMMRLPSEDVLHYKAYSTDGLLGISVLRRASQIIAAGDAAQRYQSAYYESGGQPSGVLQTETDLGGYVKNPDGSNSDVTNKDALRREWERVHSGPDNAYRVAILDHGLKYTPISATMEDAQFVDTHDVTVMDIANFFGVPLYKLNAGKQSYSSNEQNAIEYVTGTLHPAVTQYEQERTWKLLLPSQRREGMELHMNMMVELRGDFESRGRWYQTMREIGVYSVNDVREHEDLPDVPGGDSRRESLNFVPLEDWKTLSTNRNTDGNGGDNA